MNLIQHLVLTNGKTLTQGQPWHQADIPLIDASGKAVPASAVIFLIVFSAEVAQLGDDDEARFPAVYKVMIACVDKSGNPVPLLQNAKSGAYETLICEIPVDKVLLCVRTQDFGEALTDFRNALDVDNEKTTPEPDEPPRVSASAPTS